MTTPEQIKWIQDYFNLEMNEVDKQALKAVLDQPPVIEIKERIKYVTRVKEKVVYKPYPRVEIKKKIEKNYGLMDSLKAICAAYSIHFTRCLIADRNTKSVKAKVHFCRMVKIEHPELTYKQLATFLECHRSTIHHYWHKSKVNVPIKPIPIVRKRIMKAA